MRTTLDIEEDVMTAIKELARRDGITAGALVSALLRKALTQGAGPAATRLQEPPAVYGFRPVAGSSVVGNDQVNNLRDQQGI